MIFEKVHRTCRRLCFTGTAPLFTLFFLAPSHSAQTVTQRETSTAQLHTLEIDAVPTTATDAIRPFHFNATEEALDDLRRRIAATKWPAQETVNDATQGVQLATIRKLGDYWENNYDWRKCEAKLNALPQFVTTIDGLDIHFIHVRSKNPNALPLIVTHAGRARLSSN